MDLEELEGLGEGLEDLENLEGLYIRYKLELILLGYTNLSDRFTSFLIYPLCYILIARNKVPLSSG